MGAGDYKAVLTNVHSWMDGSLISEAQADALSGGGLIQMASGCSVGGFCQPGSSSYVDHSVFPANNILCSYVYGTSHFVTAFGDPFIITDTPEKTWRHFACLVCV
jgi:hypothetical protein